MNQTITFGLHLPIIRFKGEADHSRETYSAILELNIFLNRISRTLDKFVIFRFRHVLEDEQVSDEDDYRSLFSYAFLISGLDTNIGDPVWVFFVNIAAKETGKKVDEVENLISMMSKNIETVRREEHDIRLDELCKFLLNHSNGFGSKRGDDSSPFLYTASRYRFGTDFENAYLKFLDRYDSEDYPQAMRDFRALIQNALEITCNNLNITTQIDRKKIDISSLVGVLIGQNRLDGKLQRWSEAFTSIANESSHGDFPTPEDLQNYTLKRRILLTFQLGEQILRELENIPGNSVIGPTE